MTIPYFEIAAFTTRAFTGNPAGVCLLEEWLEDERLQAPEVVALVSWEGVRGGLVHRIGEVAPEAVTIGMAVEPVWAEQRVGAMSDISHFRPVRDG